MNYDKLQAQLTIDEDKRPRVYTDTVGKLTAGVGRNISDRDFSDDEIALMLRNDIALATAALDHALPWWRQMSDARQNVLANMCFNIGLPRLMGFKQALVAMQAGRWVAASDEMLDSAWARQVGQRAIRLATLMRRGEF